MIETYCDYFTHDCKVNDEENVINYFTPQQKPQEWQ
jgi:hypothetical protein